MGRRQQDGSYNADEMETATPMRWKPQPQQDGSCNADKMETAMAKRWKPRCRQDGSCESVMSIGTIKMVVGWRLTGRNTDERGDVELMMLCSDSDMVLCRVYRSQEYKSLVTSLLDRGESMSVDDLDENFSLRNSWEFIGGSHSQNEVFPLIWQQHILSRVSFFLWCVLHGFLATDDAFCLRGLHMVSRCLCNRDVETIRHLLLDCPMVQQARNTLKYDSVAFNAEDVIFRVLLDIRLASDAFGFNPSQLRDILDTQIGEGCGLSCLPWDFIYLLERVRALASSPSIIIRHVFREAASAADFMAN
ncbi:hypothetical protein WN943_014486 [Citrus x changshan-huyou]